MIRHNSAWLPLGILLFSPALVRGQEANPGQELREIRQLIEQQSKQLESIAQQISKLSQTADFQKSAAASANPTPPTAPEPANPAPEVPRAEAVSSGIKHVVAKGETLTSIAKHYNITVADLLKLNKIENDRKLQIGQSLNVPGKTSEPQTDTKENP